MTYYSGCDYSVKMRRYYDLAVNSAKSHHKCGSCDLLNVCRVKKNRRFWAFDAEGHAHDWRQTIKDTENVSQAAAPESCSSGHGEIHAHG